MRITMNANRKAMLLMVAFVALWAVVEEIAGRVLSVYSPYQVVWTRYGVHLLLMLAVWGWRSPEVLWRTKRPAFQLSRSMLMLGMPASWIIGTQLGVRPDTLMSIFWLSPLFILLLARVFLGERVPAVLWTASIAACSGTILLIEPSRLGPPQLLVFPMAMALCFSAYVVMTRALREETLQANLFYSALGVFIALTPVMPSLWATPNPHDLFIMVMVGVLGFATLFLLDRMAHVAPVSISAPFAYLQIGLTLGLAVLAGFNHEHTLRRAAVGVLLIAGAAAFLWMRERRRAPPVADAGPAQ